MILLMQCSPNLTSLLTVRLTGLELLPVLSVLFLRATCRNAVRIWKYQTFCVKSTLFNSSKSLEQWQNTRDRSIKNHMSYQSSYSLALADLMTAANLDVSQDYWLAISRKDLSSTDSIGLQISRSGMSDPSLLLKYLQLGTRLTRGRS